MSTPSRRPRIWGLAATPPKTVSVRSPLARTLNHRTITVFGGVGPGPQIQGLRNGVDVVIACPGRLADHMQSGHVDLGSVEITVLDEADHMADLGFLPVVRRLMDKTPQQGQRMLFSATLDGGVDVLVKRFLSNPVTHSVDSAQSPVSNMTHHVLHVSKEGRVPVLADLAAAPGKKIVFTRTKHGAKALARQLNARGVPAVELHGNLSQNARTRNLTAFGSGTATTLVATDIAARGIHVDDVSLVVHADPPVEHKAYLHRSGRTARAGNEGTVVTLMLDAQVSDVRDLTRRAGIKPTISRTHVGDALLVQIAPGERSYVAEADRVVAEPARPDNGGGNGGGKGGGRNRRGGNGGGQGAPRNGGGGGGARRQPAKSSGRRTGGGRPATGGGRPATGGGNRSHSAASFSSARGSR